MIHSKDHTVFPRGRELVEDWVAAGRFERIEELRERSGKIVSEVCGTVTHNAQQESTNP